MLDEKKIRLKTSERTGIPIETVERVMDFFWVKTREGTRTSATTIEIPGLGYYKLSNSKMRQDLKRYKLYAKQEKGEHIQRKIDLIFAKNVPHPEWDEKLVIWTEQDGFIGEKKDL